MQILDLPVETLSTRTIVEFVRVADHADYAILPSDAICPHNCLTSLSLVCSALRPLAQREHFSHVTLKRPISTQITPPCHRFLDLLNRQPIITSYVRGVVLADKEENHGDKSWILPNADVVANILLRLPHLTSFHIMTTKFVLTWAHIPEILVQAMYTIFQLPSLRTLCLTGFHDLPVDLLDRSPHVQNLHLLRSYFKHPSIQEELHAPFQGITPLSLAPSPQIRHLEIREAFPLCNFPFGCLNVPISSHLETLESFQVKCFLTDIHNVPINEFRHLKRLKFTCSPIMGHICYTEKFVNLGHLHSTLEVLDIGLTMTSNTDTELLWLVNVLNSLPAPNRTVRSLIIRLRVSFLSTERRRQFEVTSFKHLSLAFARLHNSVGSSLPSVLETVDVDITPNTAVGWDPEQVKSEMAWLGCGEIFKLRMTSALTGNRVNV